MDIYIHKFGGASLSNPQRIQNVSHIIQKLPRPTILVVSAMGKTTNALEEIVKARFFNKNNLSHLLLQLKNYHQEIIQQLFTPPNSPHYLELEKTLTYYWQYLEQLLTQPIIYPYNQFYDQVVSVGELISSAILSQYLNSIDTQNTWIDIRKILITDSQWRNANVLINESEKNFQQIILPSIHKNSLIITQGFIASTQHQFTTTLGREGSDYTAALLAYFANAPHLTIWKDVEGVLNADPRYFKNPQRINQLNYYDAIEMTYYGATVIHPKTIYPLQNKNIPLYVKSFLNPNTPGTIIHNPSQYQKTTTYSYLPQQILISLQSTEYSFFTETHIQQAFQIINHFNIKIHLMQTTALNFSICITDDEIITPPFIYELQKHFKVLYNKNVAILTIRYYQPNTLHTILQNKEILLEQRTRHHIQFVIKES